MFKFGDVVKVKSNFYNGLIGVVIDYDRNKCNSEIVYVVELESKSVNMGAYFSQIKPTNQVFYAHELEKVEVK